MNWVRILLLVVCLFFGGFAVNGQSGDCVYPIVFVHGFGGDATSFKTIYESELDGIWLGGHDVFNAVLNANTGTNIFGSDNIVDDDKVDDKILYKDDDVIIQFTDEKNDLRYSCLYVINFNNYWNENPSNPEIKNSDESNFNAKNNPGTTDKPDSRSNQSSAYKQGYVLGRAIEKILDVTGKSKVIIVAHSMGGIASREYLQRKENGINKWWADKKKEKIKSGHGVAKLFTVGTPHRGSNFHLTDVLSSNLDNIGGFIVNSEAARDLRFKITLQKPILDSPLNPFDLEGIPIQRLSGTYLFGGSENAFKDINGMDLEILRDKYYYNYDFNCNGESSNEIIGLNMPGESGKGNSSHDNVLMPLPRDIKYTYYVGTISRENGLIGQIGITGDGVVSDDRQWLYQGGNGNIRNYNNGSSVPIPSDGMPHRLSDRFTSPNFNFHIQEPNDLHQIIRGIDEGDYPFFAHAIGNISTGSSAWYSGLVQIRADKVPQNSTPNDIDLIVDSKDNNKIDPDWYVFEINQEIPAITLHFDKRDNTVAYLDFYSKIIDDYSNVNGDITIDATNQSIVSFDLSQGSSIRLKNLPNGPITLRITNQGCVSQGEYYFRVTHSLIRVANSEEAWKQPYKFKIEKEAGPCQTTCQNTCGISASISKEVDCTDKNAVPLKVTFTGEASAYTIQTNTGFSKSGLSSGTHDIGTYQNNQYVKVTITDDQNSNCCFSIDTTIDCPTESNPDDELETQIIGQTDPLSTVDISGVEYWFDDDFSNRVVAPSNEYTFLELYKLMSTSNLDAGLHTVHIRFKDTNGKYSSVISQPFEKTEGVAYKEKTLIAYQYWFDDDYATRVTEVANIPFSSTLDLMEHIDVSDLSKGLHEIHIRFVDNTLKWSNVVSKLFHKLPELNGEQNKVKKYRYWFDQKDDFTTIDIVNTNASIELLEDFDVKGLEEGEHLFHIQFQDTYDQWSSTVSYLFEKIPVIENGINEIVSYEYWLDENIENKVCVDIEPTQEYVLISNISYNDLRTGLHTFNIRFQDAAGKWSSVESKLFEKVREIPKGMNKIIGYKYWFNDNSTNSVSIDLENPQSTIELITNIDATDLENGLHTFYLQFLDITGRWSGILSETFTHSRTDTPRERIDISGNIATWYQEPLQGVSVFAKDKSTNTNSLGNYELSNLSLTGNISAEFETNPLEGVSTFDLVLTTLHILGKKPFESSWEYIAADVNGSKTVTSFDIVLMSRLILGITKDWGNEPVWRFIPSNTDFSSPNKTLEEGWNEYIPITSDLREADFIAVKTGDINGSWKPSTSSLRNAEERIPDNLWNEDYVQEVTGYDLQQFLRGEENSSSAILYQNQPNPFSNTTLIPFYLPEKTNFTLSIIDMTGRVVKIIEEEREEGIHTIAIAKLEMGSGIYIYQLEVGEERYYRRMVVNN